MLHGKWNILHDSAYEIANLFSALLTVCIHGKYIFCDLYNPCVWENIPYKSLRMNFTIIHCMCKQRISQICHCTPENILNLSLCTVCMHGDWWTRADFGYFPCERTVNIMFPFIQWFSRPWNYFHYMSQNSQFYYRLCSRVVVSVSTSRSRDGLKTY